MSVETAQFAADGITPEQRWGMFLGYLMTLDRHAFVLVRSAQKHFDNGRLSLIVRYTFFQKMLLRPATYDHLCYALQSTYGNNASISVIKPPYILDTFT